MKNNHANDANSFQVAPWFRAITGICSILLGGVHAASAQPNVSANASATIVQGVQIVNKSNLRFGPIISGSGGTVSISVAGARSITGSSTLLTSSSFPFTAATFTLTGAPGQTYTITLPTTATLTRQGGTETLSVGAFVTSPSASGALDAAGNGTLAIGGTLTIPGSQTAGYYTGLFTVTLTYP